MAVAPEAPAQHTAEGLTSHTPNQPQPVRRRGALSDVQVARLLEPIHDARVRKDGKGFSHLESWDIRRNLIRLFGFGEYSTDLLNVTLISERAEQRRKTDRDGHPYGDPYTAYTVIYRVSILLTVKVDGVELGHWHGVATGDATNQPSQADAHDLALKTADSQALKRAATNLGDQFGLSLYNKGSLDAVVLRSLPYEKQLEAPKAPLEDPPVQGEELPEAPTSESIPQVPDEFLKRINSGWSSITGCLQNLTEAKTRNWLQFLVEAGDPPALITVEALLSNRVAELKARDAQANQNAHVDVHERAGAG